MDLVAPGLSYAEVAMAALFVAIAAWEHARPERAPTHPAGPRWVVNLSLLAMRKAVGAGMAPVLVAVAAGAWFPVTLLPQAATPAGAALHAVAAILALDLGYYLAHRALHSNLLWRLHAVHHSDLDLDLTSSLRGHPVEAAIVGLALAGLAGVLGATPSEAVCYAVLVFGVQLLAHANLELPPWLARPLWHVIVTPAFHRVHHHRDEDDCHHNFAAVFVVWDRLLGTARSPAAAGTVAYGVAGYAEPRFQRLGWLLLQPALPRR